MCMMASFYRASTSIFSLGGTFTCIKYWPTILVKLGLVSRLQTFLCSDFNGFICITYSLYDAFGLLDSNFNELDLFFCPLRWALRTLSRSLVSVHHFFFFDFEAVFSCLPLLNIEIIFDKNRSFLWSWAVFRLYYYEYLLHWAMVHRRRRPTTISCFFFPTYCCLNTRFIRYGFKEFIIFKISSTKCRATASYFSFT